MQLTSDLTSTNQRAGSYALFVMMFLVTLSDCTYASGEGRGPDVVRMAEFTDMRAEQVTARWRSLSRIAAEQLMQEPGGGQVIILDAHHVGRNGHFAAGIRNSFNEVPRLRGLVLTNTPIDSAALESLHQLPELEFLDLSGTAIDDEGLKHVSRLQHLRTINLGFTRVSASGLAHLERLDQLQTLILKGRQITDTWLGPVGRLRSLQELHITDAQISDDGLAALTPLKELRAIALEGTPVTGTGLDHLRVLHNLRLLDVSNTELNNNGLATICLLDQLAALSLEFCGSLTGDGLVHLPKLTGLHALSLRQTGFRNRFGGTVLQNIAPLKRLKVLDLFATAIDDDALVHLAALTELRELDLSLTNVTDSGLVHIADLPLLEKFSIDSHAGFSKPVVTNAGLKTISRLQTLEYLSVVGARVTAAGIRELETALPKLRTLRRDGENLTSPVAAHRSDTGPIDFDGSWPDWRGPDRNGQSKETGLLSSWSPDGPPLVWSVSTVGRGWASVAVADGAIYTIGRETAISDDEASDVFVIALAVTDGSLLWKRSVGRTDRNAMSTPIVDSGLVFALDPDGALRCLEAKTGDQVWSRHYVDDFGGNPPQGRGFAETPLVDRRRLICTPGGKQAGIVALDMQSGDLIWEQPLPVFGDSARDEPSFASPLVTEIDGRRIYIVAIGHGLAMIDATDGTFLCGYDGLDGFTISTPVVREDLVFSSIGSGTGSALIRLLPNTTGGIDVNEQYVLSPARFQNQHGGFVLVGDSIFGGHGNNNGLPTCIDVATGKILWKTRGPGTGSASVIYADGHLYFRYQDGVMALIDASRDGYRLKGSFRVPGADRERWAHPAIAGKRLYLREHEHLFVYDLRIPL
ncbi:MAG: PQQ-binding-like beta-propeller repeat protein [Fuerstiella sp.]|nr:PQQ-binding-like beta-propeller repeat protein [Fuerstiella sp.]